jgi:hypothetical protein
MKLDIILQLLYTNGMQDLVARAVQIENNISMPFVVGDLIPVDITRYELPEGKQFRDSKGRDSNSHYGQLLLTIESVNPYNLDTPYLVILPNGTTKMVKPSDRTSISEIIDSLDNTSKSPRALAE